MVVLSKSSEAHYGSEGTDGNAALITPSPRSLHSRAVGHELATSRFAARGASSLDSSFVPPSDRVPASSEVVIRSAATLCVRR
jgi:hypothetical protein